MLLRRYQVCEIEIMSKSIAKYIRHVMRSIWREIAENKLSRAQLIISPPREMKEITDASADRSHVASNDAHIASTKR